MNHGDTGTTETHGDGNDEFHCADAKQRANQLCADIIAAALRVHSTLGPGLLESAYERCLEIDLAARDIECRRQVLVPITYLGVRLADAYRLDLLVEELVVVELKTVDRIEPIHEAQLLTYLRLSNRWLGLILNFQAQLLKHGLTRLVNG